MHISQRISLHTCIIHTVQRCFKCPHSELFSMIFEQKFTPVWEAFMHYISTITSHHLTSDSTEPDVRCDVIINTLQKKDLDLYAKKQTNIRFIVLIYGRLEELTALWRSEPRTVLTSLWGPVVVLRGLYLDSAHHELVTPLLFQTMSYSVVLYSITVLKKNLMISHGRGAKDPQRVGR